MTENLYQYQQKVGILYYKSNGRIIQLISVPENVLAIQMTDDIGFIEAPRQDYSNKRVYNGRIVNKKKFEIKQKKNKFSNIPIGTVAEIQGSSYPSYEIDDGEIEFEPNIGGFYQVRFRHIDYQEKMMDFTL